MDNDPPILSHDECVALSKLTEDESAATAADPGLATIGPKAVAAYLIHTGDGSTHLSRFIEDDLDVAVEALDHTEAARLKLALQHFLSSYRPDGMPMGSPRP
jgi:hypothetical protein